ncbi:MAG: hypothetical protein KKF54_07595 [Candidatus Omnitrophica bacterium]|nr:hypothetical protein [Candidatus Omnitrophota bacterium]
MCHRTSLFLTGLIIFVFLGFFTNRIWGYNRQMLVYSIKSIPFEQYVIPHEKDNIDISFAEYNSVVTLIYPTPKEKTPPNTLEIISKCKESLRRGVKDIVIAQYKNSAVKDYLTAEGEIKLFTAAEYVNLINKPREFTIQILSDNNMIGAEFRSREITSGTGDISCFYITFIYNNEAAKVEKIIISKARLDKEKK